MPDPVPSIQPLRDIFNGVLTGYTVLAGMQFDVFTPLGDGPRSAAQVAAALGLDADPLTRLLYGLVACDLLTVEDGRFANTPLADAYLVRGRPAYLGSHDHLAQAWSIIAQTAASVRRNAPQARHDFAAMGEAELRDFLRLLDPTLRGYGRNMAGRIDFSRHRVVADVGGGSGGLAVALVEAHPHLEAIVIELPGVAPVTRQLLAEAGAGERIGVVAADVVAAPPPGTYDAAMLMRFVQVLGAEENRRVVRNVAASLAPGGTLYICGAVVDDSRTAPPMSVLADLLFLNVYDRGRSYTEEEHRAWLEEAGLTGIERTIVNHESSLIVGHKPG